MRKFLKKVADKYGFKITEFLSYRSDMGTQCIKVSANGPNQQVVSFYDGYWIGSDDSRQFLIKEFEKALNLYPTL